MENYAFILLVADVKCQSRKQATCGILSKKEMNDIVTLRRIGGLSSLLERMLELCKTDVPGEL